MHRAVRLACLLLVLACPERLPAQADAAEARDLLAHVVALAGKDPDTCRSYLFGRLKAAGARPTFEEYVTRGQRGKNVVLTLGSEDPALVLIAHLDHLSLSPGADDDASGCAVLLELVEELLGEGPAPRRRVHVVFADGGKKGSAGAADFLARRDGVALAGALSIDLVGRGDTAVIGRTPPLQDDPVFSLCLQVLGRKGGPPWRQAACLPPSEDQSFRDRGVPAACLLMLPGDQVDAVEAWLESRGRGGVKAPRILELTRGNRDAVEHIEARALRTALALVRAFVRAADTARLPARPVRKDLARDLRRLRHLVDDDAALLATTAEERKRLLQDVGPHAFLVTLLEELESRGPTALPASRRLLKAHVAGSVLRGALEEALQAGDPGVLRARLQDLYRKHSADLVWNEEIGAVQLGAREEGVK